jgi:hypothetical protein
MYKVDPETNKFAEYHEVTCPLDSKDRKFALLDKRGWWEHQAAKPHYSFEVFYELHNSEADASKAMDVRVAFLKDEGWKYVFTSEYDQTTNSWKPVRIR